MLYNKPYTTTTKKLYMYNINNDKKGNQEKTCKFLLKKWT
jgi:hypothetical protein